MSNERAELACLFDAAAAVAKTQYGDVARSVTVRTMSGQRADFTVPHGWEPIETGERQRIARCPAACVEVLLTLAEIGHRLTLDALISAMEDKGRPRARSTVGDTLAQLTELGFVDNRQDCQPRGYGLIG